MIKVLQIGLSINPGGVETLVLNYNKFIDKKQYIFDYVDLYGEGLAFQDKIKEYGGKIFTLLNYKRHPVKAFLMLKNIINDYDIIHIHMQTAANIIPVLAGLNQKNTIVICHSHSSSVPAGLFRNLLHNLNVNILRKMNVEKWACGKQAGLWMWGKTFKLDDIIPNAIDASKYIFNNSERMGKRKISGFDDKDKVIGFVGRFGEEKNVFFILKILEQLQLVSKEFKLLTVGGNELYEKFIEEVKNKGLKDCYYSAGIQSNSSEWYQAMDALVLPSFFEGFPMVCVEAQASGLPCFVSENVSKEVNITDKVYFLPINENDECLWANKIIEVLSSIDNRNISFDNEYNLYNAVRVLQDKYKSLV